MGAEATPPGCLHVVSTLTPAAGSRGLGMKRGSLMRLSFLHCEARCVLCISGLVRDTGRVRRGPLRGWGGREGKVAGSTRLCRPSTRRGLAARGSCPVRSEVWGEVSSHLSTPGCLQPPVLRLLEAAWGPASAPGSAAQVKAHGRQDGPQHPSPRRPWGGARAFARVSGEGRAETPRSFCEQPQVGRSRLRAGLARPGSRHSSV